MHMYSLHGIAVSGVILGASLVAPSTVLHPHFFGPEPRFVDTLKGMLWTPLEPRQYLTSLGL
jgi:hypothetical protein